MKTKYLLLPLLLFFSFELAAQLDTKHWIPPFFAKVEDGTGTANIRDHFVSLSTPATDTIPVVIRDGFGNLIDTVFISKASPQEYTFGPTGNATGNPATSVYPFNVIPRDSLNMPIRSQGLYFESFQPFFVNMRHKSGSQGFSLTSKGQVGLGTKFFSGHIYTIRNENSDANSWNNERRSHFISVMATEDNTQVTIDMIKEPINFIDQTPGEPITFTLDAFESYVVGVDHNNLSNEDINNVNGTRITSDKPIVTNSGSWLSGNQQGQCIGADQLVTAEVTGQEYILVRGLGDETTERPMVVAIEDGTEVFLNDETDPIAILDEGEFYFVETEKFTANENLYILATEKVYVFQTVSGSASNIGPTVGLNFIPPLNCVGAKEVNLPFVNSLAGTDDEDGGRINIITKAGTSIFVNDDPSPLTGAQTVTGNTEWVTYAFDPPNNNVNIVSDSVMNVALLTRDGVVGSAGYFSGFTLEPVVGLSAGITGSTPCIPGNAVLQVFGFDTYQWYFEGEEIEGATSNTLIPEFAGQYSVEGIDIACGFRFPSNPFNIPYCPSTLGAAKEAEVVQETAPGSRIFDITYRIYIDNLAESVSQNIQVIENIEGLLPVGATAELIGTPSLVFGILSGGLNPSFDGVTDRRLLPGTGDLPGSAADAIELTIRVDMNAAEQDGYRNQVTVSSINEGINDGVT
ncbi:MAG: IgGFc-binding protein, partial [Cryomorphaceae bacterium]